MRSGISEISKHFAFCAGETETKIYRRTNELEVFFSFHAYLPKGKSDEAGKTLLLAPVSSERNNRSKEEKDKSRMNKFIFHPAILELKKTI